MCCILSSSCSPGGLTCSILKKINTTYLLLCAFLYLLVRFLSKSMGITLIAVLFLTDYLYGRKNIVGLIKEKIPMILFFVGWDYLYGLGRLPDWIRIGWRSRKHSQLMQ